MINKTNKLWYRRGGKDYSLNLIEKADWDGAGYPAGLGVRIGGANWYVPASPTLNLPFIGTVIPANTIHFRKNGTIYHCFNATPQITFEFSNTTLVDEYDKAYGYRKTLSKVKLNISISTSLVIYVTNNGGSTWTNVGTLEAGARSISPNYSMTSSLNHGYALPGHSGLGVKAVPKVGTKTITGSVTWTAWNSAFNRYIAANVSLNDTFPQGYIYVKGTWSSWGPPWSTSGDSDVLYANEKTGSASRYFTDVNMTSAKMTLYYVPQATGFSTANIKSRSWSPSQIQTLIHSPITDSLSFTAMGSAVENIAISTNISLGSSSWSTSIEQKWWGY